ncbi:MAG: response regulator [candidate division Zixibacteria bacterium]|nr:response regulator [candidate division Zixibacteria bacterium]
MSTILLVDDEKMNLKILSTVLRKGRYQFLEAESGEEALELLERENVDLIVLDLMMPGMDGFQTLERIEQNRSTAFIPVIIASALKDSVAIEKGLELGANDYFTKPLSDDDRRFQLPLKVRNLIKMKKMQDELVNLNHELRKMQDRLIEKERESVVVEMAGAASHELNQPLTAILGNLQLVMAKLSEDDPLTEKLNKVLNQVDRMVEIVRKVGQITKYKTKKYAENVRIVDIDKSSSLNQKKVATKEKVEKTN